MTASTSIDLLDLLRKAGVAHDTDFLREGVRVLTQALMEAEVSAHLNAERHERTVERTGQRNGYRDRQWDTRVGTIDLRVPRVRDGSYFPVLQSRASGRSGRWRRWCRRPTCRASRRGGWTSWCKRWA